MTVRGHITRLTASEAHGTGAGITTLGTGTHGALGATEDGTVLGTAGMTHGTTGATGAAGMIRGTTAMRDGTEDSGALIMPDGTEAGTHIGTAITTDGIRDITTAITLVYNTSTHGGD